MEYNASQPDLLLTCLTRSNFPDSDHAKRVPRHAET